jgi:Tfp pilus assembly protein PilE
LPSLDKNDIIPSVKRREFFMKKSEQGRSMIEMLGVLGVMAVITLLAITAYRIAYRNSKMNDLKQDVASISQQLGKVYSNQRYTDEGVVLGEDKTFENLFIETKMFKSSTTPFGGSYELSAISNDMFELKVTGAEAEDCNYIISDDAITKKFPEISMACEDISGTDYYSPNNPNSGNQIPSELQDLINGKTTKELSDMCINLKDVEACKAVAYKDDADATQLFYACHYSNGDANACDTMIAHPDTTTDYLTSVCVSSRTNKYAPSCDALLASENSTAKNLSDVCINNKSVDACKGVATKDDANSSQLFYACHYSNGDTNACDTMIAHPDTTTDYLTSVCVSSRTNKYGPSCDALLASENSTAKNLSDVCINNKSVDACKGVATKDDANSSQLFYACHYSNGDANACDTMIAHPDTSTDYLTSVCVSSRTNKYDPACSAALSNESSTAKNMSDICINNKNVDACKAVATKNDANASQLLHACAYSQRDASTCAASCSAGNEGDCKY